MGKPKFSDVLYDIEKIKNKNTGLHTFNINLTKMLDIEGKRRGYGFSVFCIKRGVKYIPEGLNIYPHSLWHRFVFAIPKRFKIYHIPFQFGKYFPITGQKIVLTIHDLNFLYEKQGYNKAKRLRRLQNNINRADYLVAISNFTKEDVIRHLNTKDKPFKVIYNGTIPIDQTTIDNSRKLNSKEFIFSISTVLPKKNFHVLPCLLVGNDYELIIAGNPSPYSEIIMDEAVKYGVEDRVKLIGSIEEEDKNWYLKNCKAFVFPSIAEGFGIPVIEAMNFGKPTFLSLHTCLPEIGQNHCYYFNENFDRELMQEEFKAGLSDFEENGDPQAIINHSKQFSWEKAASEYWDIYEELMNKGEF